MFESSNLVRQKDLEELALNPIFEKFNEKKVLITGSTGLIGSEIVLALMCANRIKNLNIKVVALARNIKKAERIFELILSRKNFEIVIQDVVDEVKYDDEVDYVIHCASVTKSKEMVENPERCLKVTIAGTKNILEFVRNKDISGFCYLSSIEVYGGLKSDYDVKEDIQLIELDLNNPRNSYPQSKRLAENLCIEYFREYNTPVKIARLTQTFGAGIEKSENRMFAQFAKNIVQKKDIILHTEGNSYKNYCYLTDAVLGILVMLINGKNGEIYNVANYDTGIAVKDLALRLCQKYSTSKLKIELNNKMGYNQDIKIKLNSDKLESLGWKASIGLDEMFDRLIESLEVEKRIRG